MEKKVQIIQETTLYKGWSILKEYIIRYRFKDGRLADLKREIYNSGDGAAVLLYDPAREKILLVRQFRLAALLNGHPDGFILETCAGMLDDRHPEEAIRREIEEETGYRIKQLEKTGEVYATPGAHMEKIHLYAARYDENDRVSAGGGNAEENEEMDIIELTFEEARQFVNNGKWEDAKTLILVQHAIIKGWIS